MQKLRAEIEDLKSANSLLNGLITNRDAEIKRLTKEAWETFEANSDLAKMIAEKDAEIERLRFLLESNRTRADLYAAEIERLRAFLYAIGGANDNPHCFNANVEAVLDEWRALEGK